MTASAPSGETLVRARELFLEGELTSASGVREEIRASWQRSRQFVVEPEHVEPTYVYRPHAQQLLIDCAKPVLRHLADEIANEPVSLLLTDAHGIVLDRVCGDPGLARMLDSKRLAPGFSYAEASVGTNGIGTALEMRAPILVTGREHFVEDLGVFSCAGVPILHPLTSVVLGVLDLTSWAVDSNPLLLGFARTAARRIRERMLEAAGQCEIALLRDYLTTCQHSGGPVIALSEKLTMMNAYTQQRFAAADQQALLAGVADATGSSRPMTLLVDLPSGQMARLEYRPVLTDAGALAGGVVRVQAQSLPTGREPDKPAPTRLPGVVGTSAVWQRACRAVLDSRRRSEWLVVEGEPGVGKLTLLRAAHQAVHPGGHFRVLDAPGADDIEGWLDEAADELDGPATGALVLRRVDLLPDRAICALGELLLEGAAPAAAEVRGPWVAMTLLATPRNTAVATDLLPHFPHTVSVPALRHHAEDLPQLCRVLLDRIRTDSQLELSVAAANQLARMPWPGNVEQLHRVLTRAAAQRRTGVLGTDDLPAECRSVNRRRLTVLETLERDAIVEALDTHRGSKAEAAASLGMSRATIYRKIKGFGIEPASAAARRDRKT